MGDRDIMQMSPKDLTKGEIGKIRNFVMDAIAAGHMSKKEGLARLKRFGISIRGMAVGGMPKKKMASGGYSKPHNYFAGGNVTNNLKSK